MQLQRQMVQGVAQRGLRARQPKLELRLRWRDAQRAELKAGDAPAAHALAPARQRTDRQMQARARLTRTFVHHERDRRNMGQRRVAGAEEHRP